MTLTPEQWNVLREADRLPPCLAAARMAGRTFIEEAARWTEWLTSGDAAVDR